MSETKIIEIGRLLRAGTSSFVAGCRVAQVDAPAFGALVRVPVSPAYEIFGLIYDMRIEDDGLVRQLVTTETVDEAVIADNRQNRNVPLELSVLSVGYRLDGLVRHLLPPRPPLSLEKIYLCSPQELVGFSGSGRFGYFRHVLRADDAPQAELLAAHLLAARQAHAAGGDPAWFDRAAQELITLLRDDYPALMSILSALGDVV